MNTNRSYVIQSPFFTVHERAVTEDEKGESLEKYFNDVYKMFLRKLTVFEAKHSVDPIERTHLEVMFSEFIRIKGLLQSEK